MAQTISDNGVTFSNTAAAPQLFSIGASVASNAITVTLDPTTCVFRSTTATTGTPTAVQNAAQLSLVISATDSFGAVTAAGTQRIAILAINNAGTMELAASNLAGGVSLDETGVITTVTAATTATQIKSTTARTGVAYKVVGFIDVPFTTAVGYGALVTVQGYGGQALASMASLGYGQLPQASGRVQGTTYYNTYGKPIFEYFNYLIYASGTSTITVNGVVIATALGNNSNFGANSCISFIVPPGASFIISSGVSVASWTENR
jgi:hypothetical protein